MAEIYSSPPKAPNYTTLLRLRSFLHNPLPIMMEHVEKYGSTFSFGLKGRVNIITTDPDVIQHVLRKNCANYEKPVAVSEMLSAFIGQGLLTATGTYHQQQRRMIQSGFHQKEIRLLTETLNTAVHLHLTTYPGTQSKQVEILHTMRQLSFELMCKAIFGKAITLQEIGSLYQDFMQVQVFFAKIVRYPWLNRYYKLTKEPQKQAAHVHRITDLIQTIIKRCRNSQEPSEGAILANLMQARYEDTGEHLTDQQLIDEVVTLFVAGHETASDTLSWTFYLLAKHPAHLAKLRAEISENHTKSHHAGTEPGSKVVLQATIDESMRMYPPSWITDRIAMESDVVNEMQIAKDDRMIIFVYGLHRSKAHWATPDVFNPEHFSEAQKKSRHPYAFMPFGAGPRMCIGRNLALLIMESVIKHFVYQLDFQLLSTSVPIKPSMTLQPGSSMLFSVTKRT